MRSDKFGMKGLTFDDVLLVPAKSDVLPYQVDVSTNLTKDIKLNIPMMSAGMDTVTEAPMAIAIAREGGIGVIHKNMSIAAQAREVDKVKRSEHGIIIDPIFLHPDNLLADANELMGKYKISGVPITVDGKLVGIITNRDMRFEEDMSRRIGDIMTKENLVTAPVGTSLADAKAILRQHRIEKLPLVDKDGNLQGLITIKDIEKATKYPNSAKDSNGRLLAAAAVGVPQISAVYECAKVAQRYGIPIIADGGIKYSGDMAKAIAAGGNVVMLGNLLAGTEESPGETVIYQGRSYKEYRGMGSLAAMEHGSKDRYFQEDAKKLVPEGIEGRVPYKGAVADTIFQMVGGLRASMGYCGCHNIKEMIENTQFIQITSAGLRESHPHDVNITKEAPNYSVN